MDGLAALRLQIEWGADEALGSEPRDRRRPAPTPAPTPAPPHAQVPARSSLGSASPPGGSYGSVEEVDAALQATGGAGLAITAQHFVGIRGRPEAAVLVIGDCPGEAEERSGVAFSGEAGRLLATMFVSAGIDPDDCAFVYLVPWRPPGGRPPTEAEIAVCAPLLLARLALRPPRVAVPCGGIAARILLGPTAGARSRGRLLAASIPGSQPMNCLVLQAPEQAMASARGKSQVWLAMRLLHRTIYSVEPKRVGEITIS